MKVKQVPLWLLLLALCVNLLASPAAAVDGGRHTETLSGKSLAILGDSYCAGYGLNFADGEAAWPYLLADTWGVFYYDHAISGSTLGEGEHGSMPMVQRVRELPQQLLDVIIIQGGSNDWSHNIPVGDVESRDTETAMGALNTILDVLQQAHPESLLICFTPWISNGAKNDLGLETTEYGDAMEELCRRRGILCYQAEDADANGIHMDDAEFRTEFCLTPTDRWHLNEKGQRMFASVFAQWLQGQLYGAAEPWEKFADLMSGPDVLRQAVNRLLESGIMQGTTENLFSPTRAAKRSTLAVTLYRMAGRPGHIPEEPEEQQAMAWATGLGILSGDLGPDRSLSRRALALGLYRYETQVRGGEITSISSLGHDADGTDLDPESAVAMGWALQEGLLEQLDGRLSPQGSVSRAALARALATLLKNSAL